MPTALEALRDALYKYTTTTTNTTNSWLSKIAGRAKCQKHLHSRPRTTGFRSIAGRANYEVTKTVTDDHAV